MARDLDQMLDVLAARPVEANLEGLEAGVWARVDSVRQARQQSAGARTQIAVAIVALVMGAVVGGLSASRSPGRAEAVVLSEDAHFAPSMAVEEGA